MQENYVNDIPILEGEEMWAQEAIDRPKGKYKVSYYMGGGMRAAFKWFNTFHEASDFSMKVRTGDVIEIKWYPNES
jgi:hypothetical protein